MVRFFFFSSEVQVHCRLCLGLQGVTLNFVPEFIFSRVFHTVSFLAAHRLWLVTLLNHLSGTTDLNLVGSGTFRSSSLGGKGGFAAVL